MVISLIIILLIAFSGFVLTYFFAERETFLWRFAAGNIIGSAIFGLTGFVIANFFGLPALAVSVALLISLAPLALLKRADIYKKFRGDWKQGFNKTQGLGYKKFLRVGYYVGFFLLFLIFFDRAMFEMSDGGIYTGGSQNLGDLPFHLGAIFSFTEGNNFPPQNPSFANTKFSYPFVADLLTAFFMKFGADVKSAMLMQNVFWAFSLLFVLERFVFKLTNNKFAGKIAPVLLFFSGGFGFLWFFKDFFEQSKGFFEFFYNLPRDYTIGEKFRWGNSLVTLFMTQRSLLLGMPLTIIVLQKIWEIFTREKVEKGKSEKEIEPNKNNFFTFSHFHISTFLVGLLAGTLPLIHLHSLVVLFVVGVFMLILKPEKWREWIAFGVGTGVVAIPALVWAMTGTATRTGEFIAFHFGWDVRDDNFFWFWLKNTGIFIPILIFGIFLTQRRKDAEEEKGKNHKTKRKIEDQNLKTKDLILFYLPFVFLFIISITFKLAPWEWDNIKVLIYWFVASLPFASFALAWIYNQGKIFKIIAVGCLIVLTFSGALDVWRVVSNQINYKVFDTDSVAIAGEIKLRTPPNALFLNAPTYNSSVVLSGRRSLMRYNGHLSSHGIDYIERETDVKAIYEGNATADILLRKYDIEYVLISPEERSALTVNEQYFRKYLIIAEKGQYRIHKVK